MTPPKCRVELSRQFVIFTQITDIVTYEEPSAKTRYVLSLFNMRYMFLAQGSSYSHIEYRPILTLLSVLGLSHVAVTL